MSNEVHTQKNIAKYRLISQKLEDNISKGEYPIGYKLPPERELAKLFNVSLLTIRQSLDCLEQDGLISRERGRGTFVKSDKPINQNKRKDTHSIGLIIVDNTDIEQAVRAYNSAEYYQQQVMAIDARLADFDHHLVVSHTTVQALISGKLPKPLEQEVLGGVILDGFIDASLIELFKKLSIPVVLLGNVLDYDPVPTVRCDFLQAGYLISRELFKLNKEKVIFATEAFRLNYTPELYDGYCQACREVGANEHLHTFINRGGKDDDLAQLYDMIARQKESPFCLFLHYNIAHKLIEIYQAFGLNFADYPVVVFGAADFVSPEMQRRINVNSADGKLIAKLAVDLIEDMIAGDKVGSITVKPKVTAWAEDGEFRIDMEWE